MMSTETRPQHFGALDGLRGLAALAVVFSHAIGVYSDTARPSGILLMGLQLIGNFGQPAVVLFFVLSGFVLFTSLEKRPAFSAYTVRRIFRIWPALVVALAAALALHAVVPLRAGFGPWTTWNWAWTADPLMVARNLLLLCFKESDRMLVPVSWSLALEVCFSALLFPLAIVLRRSAMGFAVLTLAAYAAGRLILNTLDVPLNAQVGGTLSGGTGLVLYYLPAFCVGMATAYLVLSGNLRRLNPWMQGAGFGLAVMVGRFAHDPAIAGLGDAAAIFLVVRPGPIAQMLTHLVTAWLGRISYSLYVIHFPLLMALTFGLAPVVGLVPALALLPPLSLGLATLMYEFVEKPGIAWGKAITGGSAARIPVAS
jgi:peptidoglycan/LPS O-acetylase OafA/YrhL